MVYGICATTAERLWLADWLEAQPNADDPAMFEGVLRQFQLGTAWTEATPAAPELVRELIDVWDRRGGDWTIN